MERNGINIFLEVRQKKSKNVNFPLQIHFLYKQVFLTQYWNFPNYFTIPVSTLPQQFLPKIFWVPIFCTCTLEESEKVSCTPEIMTNLSK